MIRLVNDLNPYQTVLIKEDGNPRYSCPAIEDFLKKCLPYLKDIPQLERLLHYQDEIESIVDEVIDRAISEFFWFYPIEERPYIREFLRQVIQPAVRQAINWVCSLMQALIAIESAKENFDLILCRYLLVELLRLLNDMIEEVLKEVDRWYREFRDRWDPDNPPEALPDPNLNYEAIYDEVTIGLALLVAATLVTIIILAPEVGIIAGAYALLVEGSLMPVAIVSGILAVLLLSGETNADVLIEEIHNDPIYQAAEDQWIQDVFDEATNNFCEVSGPSMEQMITDLEDDVEFACQTADRFNNLLQLEIYNAQTIGISLTPTSWPCADTYRRLQIAFDANCEGGESLPLDDDGTETSPTSLEDE